MVGTLAKHLLAQLLALEHRVAFLGLVSSGCNGEYG